MDLRSYLKENKICIRAFAKMTGYSPLHICNYMNGKTRITKRTAWIWSTMTDNKCSIEDLMDANPKISLVYEMRKAKQKIKEMVG